MQRGRGGHANGQRFQGKSPKGKGPFQKIRKPDLRPKTVPVSKRIRDVTRLINKPDLDPAVKAAQEKKLAALTEELEQRKRVSLERKYASRYHKIRFFERVKLERRLAKLGRQQSTGTLSPSEEAEMQQLVEDLQYVLNFPKGEKYISILKKAEDPEAQAHLDAERARLRVLVQQQLAEAALIGDADEGRSLHAAAAKAKSSTAKRKLDADNLLNKEKKRAKRSEKMEVTGDGEDSEDEDQSELEVDSDGASESEKEEEEEKDDFFLFGSEDEGEEEEPKPAKTTKRMQSVPDDDGDGIEEMEPDDEEEEEDEEDNALVSSGDDADDVEGSESDEEEEFIDRRTSNRDRVLERQPFRGGGGRGDRGRFGGDRGRGRGGGGRRPGTENRDGKGRDPIPFRGLGGTKPVAKPPSSEKKKPVVVKTKKAKVDKAPLRKRAEGGRKRRKKI